MGFCCNSLKMYLFQKISIPTPGGGSPNPIFVSSIKLIGNILRGRGGDSKPNTFRGRRVWIFFGTKNLPLP